MPRSGGDGSGRRGGQVQQRHSLITRIVNAIFYFVRLAEFEILFLLFFLIAFLKFKDLISRPDFSQIFVKKPIDENGQWPY